MLIKNTTDIPYSQITPKSVYLNRRKFLQAMGIAGAAGMAGSQFVGLIVPDSAYATSKLSTVKGPFGTTEKITPVNDVTHYNNFYEFGTDKSDPAKNAQNFRTSAWNVSVEGEVKKPRKFSMDEILKLAPLEERIYRHRCVEAWSIVVPWIGYPLNTIAKLVEPTSKAQFVAFESYFDPQQMPQAKYTGLQYPYVEGLRLDEAMHPLTLISVGMYGETLPNQDGAPVRITVPWKYGFKSIKSIVKIRFQEKQPPTTWNIINSHEYGFYSNVNPTVDHPRWTQAKERRLGEILRRNTLMFNGYGEQVAAMYNGMDLKKYY
ncbi:MAG TPA: protein-methionine-sulfoxide reductase catalytic subunit MsrP [Candidatus Dormibacteraeota bacterium]|nr:protein-methionine-sulfoxide reductase catalytic subunit MsrP [Candidatus Dormibacteraeota bacterium]